MLPTVEQHDAHRYDDEEDYDIFEKKQRLGNAYVATEKDDINDPFLYLFDPDLPLRHMVFSSWFIRANSMASESTTGRNAPALTWKACYHLIEESASRLKLVDVLDDEDFGVSG
jgi:hypothetical protein